MSISALGTGPYQSQNACLHPLCSAWVLVAMLIKQSLLTSLWALCNSCSPSPTYFKPNEFSQGFKEELIQICHFLLEIQLLLKTSFSCFSKCCHVALVFLLPRASLLPLLSPGTPPPISCMPTHPPTLMVSLWSPKWAAGQGPGGAV